MKTNVLITVDVEFSIAGAFQHPSTHKPVGRQAVLCELNGRSHGLGFLLDTLSEHSLPATFFVEALNPHYFGDPPMRELARMIVARGQDVQLHLHPCWTYFDKPDWVEQLPIDPPNDDIRQRTRAQMTALMNDGIAAMERWGLPRPQALRTGSMFVNLDVYRAMRDAAIPYASNVGVGVFKPAEPELQLYAGSQYIEGILEFPVLTYQDLRIGSHAHLKALTITGTSADEMRRLLQSAHQRGIGSVTILTHPFEFVKCHTEQFTTVKQNRINQRRFVQLCQFLAANDANFEVCTLVACARSGDHAEQRGNDLLRVPIHTAALRIIENRLNDRLGWL